MFEEFEEYGLRYDGDVEVLVVYNMNQETEEILGADQDNPFPFDDNGGEPDGPSWYVDANDVSPEIIDQIKINRLGHVATVHVFTTYEGSREQKHLLNSRFPFRWCGYSGRGVAYARDAE